MVVAGMSPVHVLSNCQQGCLAQRSLHGQWDDLATVMFL